MIIYKAGMAVWLNTKIFYFSSYLLAKWSLLSFQLADTDQAHKEVHKATTNLHRCEKAARKGKPGGQQAFVQAVEVCTFILAFFSYIMHISNATAQGWVCWHPWRISDIIHSSSAHRVGHRYTESICINVFFPLFNRSHLSHFSHLASCLAASLGLVYGIRWWQ